MDYTRRVILYGPYDMLHHFISLKENRDYYLNGTSRLEILGNGFSNMYSPIRRDAFMIQECCKGKVSEISA